MDSKFPFQAYETMKVCHSQNADKSTDVSIKLNELRTRSFKERIRIHHINGTGAEATKTYTLAAKHQQGSPCWYTGSQRLEIQFTNKAWFLWDEASLLYFVLLYPWYEALRVLTGKIIYPCFSSQSGVSCIDIRLKPIAKYFVTGFLICLPLVNRNGW